MPATVSLAAPTASFATLLARWDDFALGGGGVDTTAQH
jgi:hypothetical protein